MRSKFLMIQMVALFLGATLSADSYCGYDNSDCCDSNGLGVHADWIFWQARVCDLDFAVPFDGTNAIGDVRKVDPDYEHGFRVGVDKTCGCWSFGGNYTYYRARASGAFADLTNGDIAGTRIVPDYSLLTQGTIHNASANWDMNFDTADIMMGYQILSCGCFEANLIGGVKLAYIDQNMNTTYSFTTQGEGPVLNVDAIRQKIDMDAYGASLGFEPSYHLSRCMDLYGVFSYDALIGKFDRTFHYQTTSGANNPVVRANLRDDCWSWIGVANLVVGVRSKWDDMFCGKGSVIFSAGYEFHHWFDAAGFLGHQNVDNTNANLITIDRCLKAMGFDGPFVRLEATF